MGTLDFKDKKIALLGFGGEGQSAYSYYKNTGARIYIFDEQGNSKLETLSPEVVVTIGEANDWMLDDFDLVIRSPGISPHKYHTESKVSSVTSEFFNKCPAPIIGVTGTKGKGTTASLITKILEESGRKVHLLGNIGKPALDKLSEISAEDVVVYELSSFQLWDMKKSPKIAVVLMIQPEHLDVHKDFDEYLEAKSNIASHQPADGVVVYHPTNPESKRIADVSSGEKYRYMSNEAADIVNEKLVIGGIEVMNTKDFGLLGPHNRENICAALSASWQLTNNVEATKIAISGFTGLEHRLELAGEVDGVKYYNDSFATIPEASVAAIKSFSTPIIIILGGSEKHSDYSKLANYINSAENIKRVVLIGEMGQRIQEALDSVGFDKYQKVGGDMKEIVPAAQTIAEDGDTVLLSPACASFDMFDSYKQRGQLFKQSVEDL